MKKPAPFWLLLSRAVVICSLLFSVHVVGEVSSPKVLEMHAKDIIRIEDPRLKADMILILESLRNAPNVDHMALDLLRERFSQENVQLGLVEAEQAVLTVKHYRPSDTEERSVNVAGLLISLGETNTIKEVVQNMLTGQPSEKKRARLALARSGQAKVIAELVDALFRDESVLPERHGEDVFISRGSVDATYVVLDILRQSGQFPPAVTSWAQACRRLTIDKSRALLRDWWKLNEKAMRTNCFGDTLPLPGVTATPQRDRSGGSDRGQP